MTTLVEEIIEILNSCALAETAIINLQEARLDHPRPEPMLLLLDLSSRLRTLRAAADGLIVRLILKIESMHPFDWGSITDEKAKYYLKQIVTGARRIAANAANAQRILAHPKPQSLMHTDYLGCNPEEQFAAAQYFEGLAGAIRLLVPDAETLYGSKPEEKQRLIAFDLSD